MNNSKAAYGYFALKVDMAKDYDRVNWKFLGDMLRIMGVSVTTNSLIMACVSTASFSINFFLKAFSINLNGSPQGLYQRLSMLMHQFELQGLYQGYKINRRAPAISHLKFADDLFFFGENTRVNIQNLKKLLKEDADMSGKLINYDNFSIHFSKGIPQWMRQTTILDLGVRQMTIEDKYLGIYPLKSDYRISSFDSLTDKITSKLPGWRIHFVNSVGRTILSKSTISAIPIYFMGFCLFPKGVTKEIKKVQRCFWWNHFIEERKLHFIIWSKMELRKEFGVLGFKNIELMNIALICKLVWRFLENEDVMWVQKLSAKYLHGVSFWLADKPDKCSATWSIMLEVRHILENRIFWQVNNGNKIHI
ncbi:uncharacterized protein LOC113280526 [Papaver somniferum]|uniref:uncharacterized protein LOC113280526 n=1 Tax=Papaver somniferum TaxID=3469 RepID=UPI000E704984|nr:uncharacterized protein LOC113280526 [Papaver somniferum]